MAPTKGKARMAGRALIDIPQNQRKTRPVPCRRCVHYMLRPKPAERAVDECRDYLVSCTDRSKPFIAPGNMKDMLTPLTAQEKAAGRP